jgi:ATP-dependent DNA helicase RecG
MALAFFGEFDVSIIDQMPAGRKPIITKIVSDSEFIKLKPWLLAKINQNQKLFVVTPLIQESEVLDTLQDAHTVFDEMNSLFSDVQDQVRIGLLHGKMNAKDKDDMMNAFKSGKINVLVATTVIEVGVDVPEATLMIIKNAERFGLSQLHQLRGRIGRNDLQSYCFLQTPKKS